MQMSKRWQALNKNHAGSQAGWWKRRQTIIVYIATILMGLLAATLVKLADGMAVDHCYSDIGCFPLSDEFYHPRHRPFNVRPWHRRRINTHFLLFNRHHSDGFLLEPWDKLNLMASHFNPLLETKIIIPGWLDSINRAVWVRRLKDSLLWLWHPVNIIIVHWQNFTPYTIATANTRVVGAELANLLKSIESELNYDRTYYHLIGHSLGAHIGGYCGDRLPGLGRITALDPARPFFQHMPKSVRLDRGDAKFVDAIHSDFTPENAIFLLMSFGMSTPVGHLDFYPNGHSYLQPGCLRDTLLSVQTGIMRGLEHSSLSLAFLEAIRYLTACDHQRSHEWFIESITNRQCTFVGVRCNEFEGLINGRCTCDDSPSACAIMGIHADQMYVHNLHEDIWPLGQRGSGRNRDPRNYQSSGQTVGSSKPSPAPPLLMRPEFLEQQIVRPAAFGGGSGSITEEEMFHATRNQIHQKLLHEAARLRQPPTPAANPVLADEMYVGLDHLEEDAAFVNYLRANLLLQQQQQQNSVPIPFFQPPQQSPIPLARPVVVQADNDDELPMMKRRLDAAESNFKDDLELIFSGNNAHPLNKHPKLMSDLDRDIENWYEDSSRWFLKTNNRPSYCVNQYQILIYLGPLKTTNGHKHLRANLLVSVIGSRGQLMNQRFIPRSAKLDSFTMQPFFVILEGSYSLGSIVSVAVGWEARIDPDPIQATISFQSTLLENAQAALPAPPRLRPFLGETMKYDYTSGFKWRPAHASTATASAARLSSSASASSSMKRVISKRSSLVDQAQSDDEKCLVEDDETGQCTISHLDVLQEAASNEQARLMTDFLLNHQNYQQPSQQVMHDDKRPIEDDGPKILAGDTEEDQDDQTEPPSNAASEMMVDAIKAAAAAAAHPHHLANELAIVAESVHQPKLQDKHHHHHQHSPPDHNQQRPPYGWPLTRPYVPITHDEFLQEHENRVTAKFHNIHHLHHADNNNQEDSIVINQIVVNPLQANYGKGSKPSKVFCPPRPGYRLRRDQTVRLSPNIFGRCHGHNSRHR